MGLGREAGEGISGVKEEVYKRTGISSIRLRYKKMRMEVNVLDYAIRGILSIKCEDRK